MNSKRSTASADRKCSTASAVNAPNEFMIFPFGEFMTDDGPHVMTRESADAIVKTFMSRGNIMSMDFDHASLDTNAPPEARVASGWIHSMEVRGEGEVWACEVEWTPDVKGWLTEEVPKYRYISPFYTCSVTDDVSKPFEVKNVALTNNPRTWNCTRLASNAAKVRGKRMEDSDLVLAGGLLAALLATMGASDASLSQYAQEIDAALKAKLGDSADKALQMFNDAAAMSDEAPVSVPAEGVAAASDAAPAMDDKAKTEEKTIAASLAMAASDIKRKSADAAAAEKLIKANEGRIPANVIPILRKASLVQVTSFIADISRGVKPSEKPFVAPAREVAKQDKKVEQRAASLAKEHGIKDVTALKTRLGGE